MYWSHLTAALAGLLCMQCIDGPSLGGRPSPPEVRVWPARSEASARVVRLEVRAGEGAPPIDVSELWLFSGELSDYHLGRINRRDLPETLAARQLPVLAWSDASGSVVTVAPSVVLEAGARYTLAAPGFGRLLEFAVAADDATPLLERIWPARGSPVGALLVLCGESAPATQFEMALEPSGLAAQLEPNFGALASGRACVAVHSPEPNPGLDPLVLPPEIAGYLLDPEPIMPGPVSGVVPIPCGEDELELGPGCAQVDDDRLSVRSADEPLLWVTATPSPARIEPARPAGRWLLRELESDSEQRVSGRAVSAAGMELPFDVVVHTRAERLHLVLSEVLFNPIGAEPAAEWIELVNDGGEPAELEGLWLRDPAGAVPLPAARLEAGQYLLLVRDDFPASPGADVPPGPGAELVHLPSLAKGGLSNSGEMLQLEDSAGQVLSRFPALASRRAGVSLARLRSDSFDDDPQAFGEHAPPGASPGASNVLAQAPP